MKFKVLLSFFLVSFFSQAIAQLPSYLAPNVKAWYPFNGNANDLSANALNLTTYYTQLTTDRWGKADSAYYFDGIGSYMTRPVFPTIIGNPVMWTMSAWFKTDTTASKCILQHGKYNSSVNTSTVYVVGNNSTVGSNTYSGTVPVNCNSTHPSGWTHVAVEYDANAFYLYVNGKVVCTKTNGNAPTGGNLTIGASYINNIIGEYFKGSIDDIAIYHYPLTLCQVATLYQSCKLTQPTNQSASVGNNATFSIINSCWDTAGITYQWQADNGSGFVNITNAGPYTGVTTRNLHISNVATSMNNNKFKCIINSGCTTKVTDTVALTVTPFNGITTTGNKNLVSLYPNPGNGNFILNYDVTTSESIFTLKDISGKIVYSYSIDKRVGKDALDLSAFSNGLYFWSLTGNGNSLSNGKVSIQK